MSKHKTHSHRRAVHHALAGAGAGAVTLAVVGNMGLAVFRTTITVGAAPVIVTGTLFELASRNIYRFFK